MSQHPLVASTSRPRAVSSSVSQEPSFYFQSKLELRVLSFPLDIQALLQLPTIFTTADFTFATLAFLVLLYTCDRMQSASPQDQLLSDRATD